MGVCVDAGVVVGDGAGELDAGVDWGDWEAGGRVGGGGVLQLAEIRNEASASVIMVISFKLFIYKITVVPTHKGCQYYSEKASRGISACMVAAKLERVISSQKVGRSGGIPTTLNP